MRSILGQRDARKRSASPVVADPKRWPSISTIDCFGDAPRMNTPLFVPGPPLAVYWMPGWRESSCSIEVWPACSISSRSMTVTSAISSLARVAWRVAVTTIGLSSASAAAACRPKGGERCRQRALLLEFHDFPERRRASPQPAGLRMESLRGV